MHPGFGGYSVKYSPWGGGMMAVCAAENFGVQGSGKVYIVSNQGAQGGINVERMVATEDGAFDVAWSEHSPNHFVVACGDGVLKLFDVSTVAENPNPVSVMRHQQGEVYSVDWNLVSKDTFVSGCWNREIKVFHPATGACVNTFVGHQKEVYRVAFSPKHNELFASCSGDGTFKLWDTRTAQSMLTQSGHNGEIILGCDWNKYDPNVLATSSVDKTVKLWDVRRPQQPLFLLRGHQSAVRTVRCSPHSRNLILSGGYDFQLCLFDTDRPQPLSQRYVQHKEFVVGCDWSLEHPGVVASTGWDSMLYVWKLGTPIVATHGAQPPLPPCPPPIKQMPVDGMNPGMPPAAPRTVPH